MGGEGEEVSLLLHPHLCTLSSAVKGQKGVVFRTFQNYRNTTVSSSFHMETDFVFIIK